MNTIAAISTFFLPVLVGVILLYALIKKTDAYGAFTEGGKEGIRLSVSLLPFLLGMLVAINILRASGFLDAMNQALSPVLIWLSIPPDLLPLLFIRPISGSASLGMVADLTATYGTEHFISRAAAIIQGSTDTTLYVLTVYFGAVGIKKMGRALTIGLLADLAGMTVAILITIWYFA
ncbi:nucleoside recognition domain-containing protein [Jeotgalibacillus sp. ET6]|uniref:spore maturation protein n=1 Tax=Jeotgalibacillus sp. ET6 TaxID=3037260 RepID=UPI002418490E|nr:nucleoside recognition domain-containing protein [Jeotgalibacillus sp. ET6]MDG5470689.1 nucleoside recognition domain-containing protein [Jeotgalibacillus sp. ET6]